MIILVISLNCMPHTTNRGFFHSLCDSFPAQGHYPGNHLMDSKGRANNRRQNRRLHTRAGRKMKLIYLKMLRINDPPERIARGAAIGVCMGVLPTFGAGIVLSFFFALLLRANKGAAVLGSFIMNPLTSPLFWTASIIIGSVITGQDYAAIMAVVEKNGILLGAGWAYAVFLAGNLIVTSAATVVAYFLVKWAVVKHRERKAQRRLERNNSL